MQLKQLISLANETEGILQKYKDVYEIKEFNTLQELKLYIKKIIEDKESKANAVHPHSILALQQTDCIHKKVINTNVESLHDISDNRTNDIEYGKLQECLLIAATDETIAWANSVNIAVVAYENSNICGQTLSNVEMVLLGFDEVDAEFLKKAWQRYHFIPWTIAVTERCVIRELTLNDMDALFELYSDEELIKFTESLFDREEETDYQCAYIKNMYRYFGYGMWLVFLKETGELIGRAGLEHREIHEQTELELGYLIGRPYQAKGYATEVCRAIIMYAKEKTGFEQINCVIQKENAMSIHLAEKLGFSHIEDYELDGKVMHRFVRELI